MSVKKLFFNSSGTTVTHIQDYDENLYYGSNVILCAGAIQTPAILQRSNIDCGNSLYDHAGFTINYGKFEPVTTTVEQNAFEDSSGCRISLLCLSLCGKVMDFQESHRLTP